MDLSPVKLTPVIKDYLWGGRRLIDEYNKKTDLACAAESWELSTHPDGESTVSNGRFKGLTLSQYIAQNGKECIGKNALKFDFFPILIKLIDAKNNLSIQVHPDDEYALKNEHEYGKTEMWYIVDCNDGAYLYYGLSRDVSKAEFEEHIRNNTLPDILNKVPVHKGDVFFIPAGTVHAICEGILICEIQQNSNTTYRVYDYNRLGADGKPRALHIEKAVRVSSLTTPPEQKRYDGNTLVSCKYFTVDHIVCKDSLSIKTKPDSFLSVVVLDGCAQMSLSDEKMSIKKGDSIFIPAQDNGLTFTGDADLIISYV